MSADIIFTLYVGPGGNGMQVSAASDCGITDLSNTAIAIDRLASCATALRKAAVNWTQHYHDQTKSDSANQSWATLLRAAGKLFKLVFDEDAQKVRTCLNAAAADAITVIVRQNVQSIWVPWGLMCDSADVEAAIADEIGRAHV